MCLHGALYSIPSNLVCNMTIFTKKMFWPLDPTAGVQGVCEDQKCDDQAYADDDADGLMIPMCRPCFEDDTKLVYQNLARSLILDKRVTQTSLIGFSKIWPKGFNKTSLTLKSLASFLLDIGQQCRSRSDVAERGV